MRRLPAVAGTFYPSDPEDLLQTIQQLFNSTNPQLRLDLVAVIAPHAGYPYAGQPQAVAIGSLPQEIERVVLLGPSHYFPLNDLAVYPTGTWVTPLGEVQVAEDLAEELLSQESLFRSGVPFHEPEHSLEVLVPWLQVRLPSFQILPILVGSLAIPDYERAGESLASVLRRLDRPWAIVTSSDLYHGYSYDEGRRMDERTLNQILEMDPTALLHAHQRGEIMACGIHPIALLLATLKSLGVEQGELLDYTNSLDVLGTRTGYFVGYAAVGFTRHA